MPKAEVGDIIEITNSGERYTGFLTFFKGCCPQFTDGYTSNTIQKIRNGDQGVVIFAQYHHRMVGHHELYVIELNSYPGKYYLVNENAFEVVGTSDAAVLPDFTETDLADLLGVISCV